MWRVKQQIAELQFNLLLNQPFEDSLLRGHPTHSVHSIHTPVQCQVLESKYATEITICIGNHHLLQCIHVLCIRN